MKKLLLGAGCGVALLIALAATPAFDIKATLFPSTITFYSENDAMTSFNQDDPILNYRDKAYVPLRNFAEAMGAEVEYKAPSEQNGNKPQINIRQPSTIRWELMRLDQAGLICSDKSLAITLHKTDESTYKVKVVNTSDSDIELEPEKFEFAVHSIFPETGEKDEQVYKRMLPELPRLLPPRYGYEAILKWDHINRDGEMLLPGNYLVSLVGAREIKYAMDGGKGAGENSKLEAACISNQLFVGLGATETQPKQITMLGEVVEIAKDGSILVKSVNSAELFYKNEYGSYTLTASFEPGLFYRIAVDFDESLQKGMFYRIRGDYDSERHGIVVRDHLNFAEYYEEWE